jgi:hypothetical protein
MPALGRAGRSESLKDRRRRRRVGRGRGGVLGSALCPGRGPRERWGSLTQLGH